MIVASKASVYELPILHGHDVSKATVDVAVLSIAQSDLIHHIFFQYPIGL